MTKDQHKSTLIWIPAPLVESVKDFLTLNREGKQEAVLQGLQELVTNLKQSGYHIVPGSNQYGEILERLEKQMKASNLYLSNEVFAVLDPSTTHCSLPSSRCT